MSIDFHDRPIIITDVETTGLLPGTHEIIEIGAIKVSHDLRELDRFDLKVAPAFIDRAEPAALKINGYTPDLWAGATTPFDAATRFRDFSAEGILCAWNITFEYGFLNTLFFNVGVAHQMDYHRIDIPSIAWMLLPELRSVSLDQVARRFNIPPEPKPHRGITGAEYELEILRLLRGKL